MEILLDMHTHTLASGHAYSTIAEVAAAAARAGAVCGWHYRACAEDAGYVSSVLFSEFKGYSEDNEWHLCAFWR